FATNSFGDSLPSNVASVTLKLVIQPVLYYRFDETGSSTLVDYANGFANNSNLVANVNGSQKVFPPNTTVLQPTASGGGEATSAFYNRQVAVGKFTTSFVLQDKNGNGSADGATFVIQNDPNGTGALGAGGGGLGYGGINNSLAVAFDLYS